MPLGIGRVNTCFQGSHSNDRSRPILNPGVKEYISKISPKVLRGMPGCEILEQNIQVDHIHLLMVIPPKYAVRALYRLYN